MQTIRINTSHPYDVMIGNGLIGESGHLIAERFGTCRAAIITETTVDALYGERVESSLRSAGLSTLRYAFPAGEQNKTLSTLSGILEFLAENHLTRSDIIVALGGGVPGDVAGFAAAVYARGIPFVQIPTTLLAAVDSSVGGKTAVDLTAGKNLAGAFHQPSLVITDVNVIRTLPSAILSDGAAEVIKYGVLYDAELFGWMCMPDWRDRLEEIIARCVSYKRDVVIEDEFDTGARRFLNLGHTFGHAIEKCSDFSVTHGQAVAMGTAIAAGAAGKHDICASVLRANRNCGLPEKTAFSASLLSEAALSDKKRTGSTIALILPEEIGRCRIEKLPVNELENAFKTGLTVVEALV